MNAWQRYGSLAARLALAAIFIDAGFGKLAGAEGAAEYIASKGLPAPMLLAILAGLVELGGGVLLAIGLGTRWAALALALFLVPTTLLFHNPIGLAAAQAQMQQLQMLKNIAIFGGMLAVAAGGADALSIDALVGRRRAAAESPQPLRRAA